MLPSPTIKTELTAGVLAVGSLGLGIAWALEPAWGPSSLLVRLVFLGFGAAIAVGSWCVFHQRIKALRQDARRCLEVLGTADDLDPTALGEALPAISSDHPFREVFDKLMASLLAQREKLAVAEHARTGVEVRARRSAAQRDQLTEILVGLADPIVAVDQFGDVIVASHTAEDLLGLHATDAAQPSLEQLQKCPELVTLLNETRRRKSPSQRQGEVVLATEGGSKTFYKISCRALSEQGALSRNDRASIHGAVAVLTDVSWLKAYQARNAEFVSAVSHEMKTPLASIKAYVELLADGDAEDEKTREEFFQIISGQTDRLQRLIENLLNLARIEAGVVQVNKTPRSVNELLLEATNVLQPAAEGKNITLQTELSPLYLGVLADRDTLLQAAINLISNALKYTHNGGTVTLRSRLSDQEVAFEVQDTGVGLSPEDCQKVFEKFYRVKKDKDMAPGTGLGLPLVKHIVEDIHRGRIEVESALGSGSTFRVILPGLAQLDV